MARQNPQEAPKKEAAKEVFRHSKSDLIANAAVFGVKPEVMTGALYCVESASKEEAEKLIKAFLRKGVK
jgi:hypothetical protein